MTLPNSVRLGPLICYEDILFGDWFAQLCSALALLLSLWLWRRQAPPHPRMPQD